MNLDEVDPARFNGQLQAALNARVVISEMYFDDSQSTNPEEWINLFKTKGYNILSVVLEIGYPTGLKRFLASSTMYSQNKTRNFTKPAMISFTQSIKNSNKRLEALSWH